MANKAHQTKARTRGEKNKEEKQMTLKEKVLEISPEDVSDAYVGGVASCPRLYSFLKGHFKKKCKDLDTCEQCWNQEYTENVGKDINVTSKNIGVGTK